HVHPVRQGLDCGDLVLPGLHREGEAGAHRHPVEEHGARPAYPMLAAHVRAGQPQLVAQEVAEQQAGFHLAGVGLAVDDQGYFMVHTASSGSGWVRGWVLRMSALRATVTARNTSQAEKTS